mmetsp:Transcript_33116/g.92773  ORF Transcript_33116/g.92773 Transcript_33116/m.92773 type:complete len:248 (-) Transcript_33116:3189-3932(-)
MKLLTTLAMMMSRGLFRRSRNSSITNTRDVAQTTEISCSRAASFCTRAPSPRTSAEGDGPPCWIWRKRRTPDPGVAGGARLEREVAAGRAVGAPWRAVPAPPRNVLPPPPAGIRSDLASSTLVPASMERRRPWRTGSNVSANSTMWSMYMRRASRACRDATSSASATRPTAKKSSALDRIMKKYTTVLSCSRRNQSCRNFGCMLRTSQTKDRRSRWTSSAGSLRDRIETVRMWLERSSSTSPRTNGR